MGGDGERVVVRVLLIKMPKKSKDLKPVKMDFTLNMHKRIRDIQFKKRAPRAVREVKRFVTKQMRTKDVRIDTALNQFIWSRSIRSVPRRIRIRVERKKNEEEDAKEKFHCIVHHVPVESFQDLQTQKVEN